MGHAVPLIDLDLPRAATFGEFVAEAALAGSRLGDDANDLRVPRDRLPECGLQNGHLAQTSDELREAARTGHLETTAHPPHTLELEHTDRLRQATHLVPPQIAQNEEPLAHLRRRLRDVDPPRLCDLLHPRRQVGRVSERRVVHPEVVADLADHDLSRVEAHPYREADPLADAQLVRITAQGVAQV